MVKYKLLYFTTSVRNTGDPWRQFYNTEKAKPLWALPKIITFQRTEFSNIFKYYKHRRIQSLINLKILYGYEINIMNSNYTTTLTKDCQINNSFLGESESRPDYKGTKQSILLYINNSPYSQDN